MGCFEKETEKQINSIKSNRTDGELCFAMLCDSHLSDQGDDTVNNIRTVDSAVGFDFMVHLGNITNGDNPKRVSEQLMRLETEKYKNSVKCGKLFVTQGDKDGWRDERYAGQLVQNIMTDEVWYNNTKYIDNYENVSRYKNKPYYYADFPEQKIRMIFLCSYNYQIDEEAEVFEKYTRIDAAQQKWLINDALGSAKNKTVLIFSHRIPRSRFEDGTDPYAYEGRVTEPVTAIMQKARRNGVDIACWFGGGYGCDCEINLCGENFAVIDSQLPKITKTACTTGVRLAKKRELNSVSQDCWDAVVVKQSKRQLMLFRFGSGEDRIINY